MRFRKSARLDTGQIRDLRGSRRAIGVGAGGLGIVGVVIYLIVALTGGGNLGALEALDQQTAGVTGSDLSAECQTGADANTDEDCRIVGFVNSIQEYWQGEFEREGIVYRPALTTFFTGSVQTGCGPATSAVGPFYCPVDQSVYIDLGFFDELRDRFGASGGPFAQAYVLAHEYGHHVQNLTGVLGSARSTDTGPTSAAVRTELQADCYAGVWAGEATGTGFLAEVSEQDIAQALDAAAAVGDDRIQEMTQGQVTPETWTHGSSAERRRWFETGYADPRPAACDTFGA
jgi:predicted metalloprotease